MTKWCLYALRFEEPRVYVGITPNPARRFQEHRDGIASDVLKYLGEPISIEVIDWFDNYQDARINERQVHLWLGLKTLRILPDPQDE